MAAKYMKDRGRAVLEALDEVVRQYRSTPARVALAWLIARPGITAPIASVSNENQLGDLVEAAALDLDPGRHRETKPRPARPFRCSVRYFGEQISAMSLMLPMLGTARSGDSAYFC